MLPWQYFSCLDNFTFYENNSTRGMLLNVDMYVRCNGFRFINIIFFCQNKGLFFFPFKAIYVRMKWKKCFFEELLSYYGNTIKLFICPWKILKNSKTHTILYAIVLFCKAETSAISFMVCSKKA